MTNDNNRLDRMRSLLVVVAAAATIAFNVLAAIGRVNGVTPEAISAEYPTVLTPAGYAFSIWSLIYLGIIAFSIYQLLPANLSRFRSARILFLISCVLNCGWIYFWHRSQIGVCLVIITLLLLSLIFLLSAFEKTAGAGGALFTKGVFGLYAGWVTAATLVNLAVFMKSVNVTMTGTAWNIFGVVLLFVAAGAGVLVRFSLRNYLYPLAIAWAATAIAVEQSGNTAIVVGAALSVIVCLVMAVSFVMNMKSSTT